MSRGRKILALLQKNESEQKVDDIGDKIDINISRTSESSSIIEAEDEKDSHITKGEFLLPSDYAEPIKPEILRRTSVSSNSSISSSSTSSTNSSSTSSTTCSSSTSSTELERITQPEAKLKKSETSQKDPYKEPNVNESIDSLNDTALAKSKFQFNI